VPRWLATVLVLVGGLAVLGGLLTTVIITFVNGPLHMSDEQVRNFFDNLVATGPERCC
jgi:hypothetical protein